MIPPITKPAQNPLVYDQGAWFSWGGIPPGAIRDLLPPSEEGKPGTVVSGPLCHLVRSLQTERYSAEDTLYQNLTPWWKPYPSTRAYTRTGL